MSDLRSRHLSLRSFLSIVAVSATGFGLGLPLDSRAEDHTGGVPALSSRPGAAYTLYLNVAGFTYSGDWGNDPGGITPGFTPSLNDISPTGTFSATDQQQIKLLWARVAQSYVGFNVNVTTVDPAVAAGQAATDALRQTFYNNTANLMHTVVGSGLRGPGNTNWQGTGDGVSGLNVASGVSPGTVLSNHTNWMFSENQAGAGNSGVINGDYIGGVIAHENGHAMGLFHQNDYNGATVVNEYSKGDTSAGNGSYVPILGEASGRQRITWRDGFSHPNNVKTMQNDVAKLLSINTAIGATAAGRTGGADLHLVNDGIGHSLATATNLPLFGDGTVNFSLATGVIVPLSESAPEAIGAANYSKDWFSFTLSDTSLITLTVHDSTQFLVAGVADGNGTLRSTLTIRDSMGGTIASGVEDATTLFKTYSGSLGAGSYFAEVGSFGGHVEDSVFDAASYFDMGAFFITGSGFAMVPEPGSLMLGLSAVFVAALRRRRSRTV